MDKKNQKYLLILALLLVPLIAITYPSADSKQTVYAVDYCLTADECNEVIDGAIREIADLDQQALEVQDELNQVEINLDQNLNQIIETESTISTIQADIASIGEMIEATQREIDQIEQKIAENEEILTDLTNQINDLGILIGSRLRVTQRFRGHNNFLEILTDSESIVDLVRRVRMINHLALNDAELLEELGELTESQQEILTALAIGKEELAEGQQTLAAQNAELAQKKGVYEEQNLLLASQREDLLTWERQLAEQREEIYQLRVSAEDILEIARTQQEILAQTPPPPITTTPGNGENSPSNSGGSGNANGSIGSPTPGGGFFIIPLERGVVTCEWGCYTVPFFHSGIDLGNFGDTSTRVLAAAAGVVVTSGWHNAYGWHVIITHNINGAIYTTLYGHLHQQPFVSVGQIVEQGHVLGTMGNTGFSFGAHLHFEIHRGHFGNPINPRYYIHFPSSW